MVRNPLRRCYFCGIKKYDDEMLCEKCKKELEEKLKNKHKRENEIVYFSDTTST